MPAADSVKQVTGIVVDAYGDWRNARLGTLPVSPPGRGEVLIKCEAAALNFQDLLMIAGKYQIKPPVPFFAGTDAAGTIVAVGPEVSGLAVGQRVAAQTRCGAFAQLVPARADHCFPIPDDLHAAAAAATSTVFATVVFALAIRGALKRGERLLVSGAAGGVGTAALQYGKQMGAEVIALVSTAAKEDMARRAGAYHVVVLDTLKDLKNDLRTALAAQGIDGVDVVLDVVGGDVFDGAIRCLRPGGRLLVIGFASGRIPEAKANYLLLKNIAVVGSALDMAFRVYAKELNAAMGQVFADMARGTLDPLITEKLPLKDFHRAAAAIADRTAVGKIVLLP